MLFALREIRRAKARFVLLVAAIALLVFLILSQRALQDGLLTSFVGGIENQSAPVLVFSVDGQRTIQGSVIDPALQRAVESAAGVAASGRIGQGTFTATRGGDPGEIDLAVVGYDDADLGAPRALSAGRLPTAPGEAVGSAADFSVGDRVEVVPAGSAEPVAFRVVGVADDVQLQVTPTLFTPWDGYVDAVRAVNPDASTVLPSAIGVAPDRGVDPDTLIERIQASSPDADALTRADAAAKTPGVAQIQSSFLAIFLLYALVVPLVTGLFFLIITFQKAASLTLLRAMGARAGSLVRSLLAQVLLVLAAGLVVGTLLYWPLSQATVGGLQLRFDPTIVAFWWVALLVLGLISALFSARRVLQIDPIEAITGGNR